MDFIGRFIKGNAEYIVAVIAFLIAGNLVGRVVGPESGGVSLAAGLIAAWLAYRWAKKRWP